MLSLPKPCIPEYFLGWCSMCGLQCAKIRRSIFYASHAPCSLHFKPELENREHELVVLIMKKKVILKNLE